MSVLRWTTLAIVAGWLATGFYVVRGDEEVVVRRFGQLRKLARAGGWHYDLPWPLAQLDRVKVHAVRTLTIGVPTDPGTSDSTPLDSLLRDRQSEFLTGDKNIVNVQVQVQYSIQDPAQYLLGSAAPEVILTSLAESLVADLIGRCGVDYVQTTGLMDLRERLTDAARRAVERQHLGIMIEDVSIGGVFPPVEVKEAFLDVSNARAEKERGIHEEQTRTEQRLAQARADSKNIVDRAAADKHRRVAVAHGEADRFSKVISQFKQESTTGNAGYLQVRNLALQRLYFSTLEELLPKLSGNVVLESQQPADLTIFPQKPSESAPVPTAP